MLRWQRWVRVSQQLLSRLTGTGGSTWQIQGPHRAPSQRFWLPRKEQWGLVTPLWPQEVCSGDGGQHQVTIMGPAFG